MSTRGTEVAVTGLGIDVGSTLAKLAIRHGDESLHYRLEPSDSLERVARFVNGSGAIRVGVTGVGAGGLAEKLHPSALRCGEFDAWGAGASTLLKMAGATPAAHYLLVSIGTGTSVMLADQGTIKRVGGTALGGGTLLGLACLVFGEQTSFSELAILAARGERRGVDLQLGELYPEMEAGGVGHFTASHFGAVALDHRDAPHAPKEDLARAVMGLVGDNVALLCAALARAHEAVKVVCCGSTLRDNPTLAQILEEMMTVNGCQPSFLSQGEFAGALGALLAAEGQAP